MEQEHLILGYLKNSLSPEDQKTFDTLLKNDPKFKENLERHQDMHVALYNAETAKLKMHLKDFEAKLVTPKTALASKFKKLYYSGAAAILLIALTIVFYTNKTVDYYEAYYAVYPNVYQPVVRGQASSSNAFQAYESGNFSTAAEAFENAKDLPGNPNLRFYLSQCYMALNQLDKAELLLQQLSTIDFEFRAESKWYLSLIYLKQGEALKAQKELEAMNTLNTKFKFEERTLILQKLDAD